MIKLERPLMKCGHATNGKSHGHDKPICIICNCEEVSDLKVLSDRKAKCTMCDCTMTSDSHLAFFEYKPDSNQDGFYCGCRGWD